MLFDIIIAIIMRSLWFAVTVRYTTEARTASAMCMYGPLGARVMHICMVGRHARAHSFNSHRLVERPAAAADLGGRSYRDWFDSAARGSMTVTPSVHTCLNDSCIVLIDIAQSISSKTKSRIKTKISTAMQQLDHESAHLSQQSRNWKVRAALPSFCLITQPTFFMPVCSLPPTLSATVSTSSSISTCSSSSRPMSLAC